MAAIGKAPWAICFVAPLLPASTSMTVLRPKHSSSSPPQSKYELDFEIDESKVRDVPASASRVRCHGEYCPDSRIQAAVSGLPGLIPALRGKHVVMIGDSLTRYQYLDLAYYVAYGRAPPHTFHEYNDYWHSNTSDYYEYVNNWQHMTSGHGFWNQWYARTNEVLNFGNATETCDCYRNLCCGDAFENRYFRDSSQDIHLTFLQWLEDNITLKGHVLPNEEKLYCSAGSCGPPAVWEYRQDEKHGMRDFLNDVVMQLKPTPTHVVMNRAKWGHLGAEARASIFRTGQNITQATGTTSFIWKTATNSLNECCEESAITNEEIVDATKHGWKIFDAFNITRSLSLYTRKHLYYDKVHLAEGVYAYLNEALLTMI